MQEMERVAEPAGALAWIHDRVRGESVTGFDLSGWPTSTWVLHAMYENQALTGLGTHDDVHRRRLEAGDAAPLIIGDMNLDEISTVTGTPLGFVVRPGRPWTRVTWADYLQRFPEFHPARDVPPCYKWFPFRSWPMSIDAPPEGSLDEESLEALLTVLAQN